MYTGQPINPTLNQHIQNKHTLMQRPQVGFAIIPVSHDKPNPNANLQQQIIPQEIAHKDMQKILDVLHNVPVAPSHKHISQVPLGSPHKEQDDASAKESGFESVNNQTLSNLAMVIGGVTTGVVLNKVLNTPSAAQRKYLAQKEMTNDIIKAVPDLVQAMTTGIAMLAGTVGIVRWLNQKTADQLRAEYDILSK